MQTHNAILFFDGECGLCHTFVRFILKNDLKNHFLFAPLQGVTAKEKLGSLPQQIDSVIYVDNFHIYVKSTAAIKIVMALGGKWKLMAILMIVPRLLRDFVYDRIAQNRKKWFRQNQQCSLMDEADFARFLP
jgi:predicted DCC family thiol-disulfide oxidoreductase YuxK